MKKNIIALRNKLIIQSMLSVKEIKKTQKPREEKSLKVLIFGGGFGNKGAQAMTFSLVNQLKNYNENVECYLMSTNDYIKNPDGDSKYQFKFIPWEFAIKSEIVSSRNRFMVKKRVTYDVGKIKNILEDADIAFDISGYALSSQWRLHTILDYLLNICVSRQYSIPLVLLPQSMGPFDFPASYKDQVDKLLKKFLPYLKKVYVREDDGMPYAKQYIKGSVERSFDLVLRSKGLDLKNIFQKDKSLKKLKVKENSVAIIPNERVFDRMDKDEMFALYRRIIETLIAKEKNVYIIWHTSEDLALCREVKKLFTQEDKVLIVEEELNCLELEGVLDQMDYIVASRYHSIVHAFKSAVPALVIGWAVKYKELLNAFSQGNYFFDCRDNIASDDICLGLNRLNENFKDESAKIKAFNDQIPAIDIAKLVKDYAN